MTTALKRKDTAVGWVKPASPITGLDHLGSAAPCIAIYSTLLPGITNVTDRARYYSFYPWYLWKYEQAGEPVEPVRFHELYRRADCLFTLVAEYHNTLTGGDPDRHGSRMVGRDTLVPALRDLERGKALRLSEFATQNEKGHRYFKNRLGGLGQYYLGTLEELGILTGRKGQFVQYDPVRGVEIARRFEGGVPSQLFWQTIAGDLVTGKVLKELAPFCPCQLPSNKPEHSWLSDLFFGCLTGDDAGRLRRSQSLALILHLTQAIASDPNASIDALTFRDACYSGSLPGGGAWAVPEMLSGIREGWRLYERNELLSICCQSMLTMFVRSLELMPHSPTNAQQVAQFLLGSPALRRVAKMTWPRFVAERRKGLPPLAEHRRSNHELRLVQRLRKELGAEETDMAALGSCMECVLHILAALVIRNELGTTSPYGELPITETMLADYPINLFTFQRAEPAWKALTVAEVVGWLIREWACDVHLRIALRKLRFEHLDTFRFYPTDQGLKSREVPPFGYSNPRVRQAIQILRDLSALETDDDGSSRITPVGIAWLDTICWK